LKDKIIENPHLKTIIINSFKDIFNLWFITSLVLLLLF
jgi:hypothetical protein